MKMKKNVGKPDQIVRYVLALVFLVLTFTVSEWFFIGTLVMFFTAFFSFCGLYNLFGINTCKLEEPKESEEN
jgi:hypothetical protein